MKAPPGARVHTPSWSPDGRWLAYVQFLGVTNHTLELASGVRRKVIDPRAAPLDPTVFKLESGGILLSEGAQFEPSKPTWRADGGALAIAASRAYSRRFREGTSQIYTVDFATGAGKYSEPAPFKSITTRGEDGPVYSPDGTAVAFVMESLLWIWPVDRAGIPTGPGRAINDEPTDAPTWSGDSRELLYLSNGRLRLIGRDGSNLRTAPLDLMWRNEPAPPRTIIHAGRFWDGRGPELRRNVDVIISGHRIEAIEPHRAQRPAEAGVQLVDASALTVLPGLWASHTHHWIGGRASGERLGRLWLAFGVTSLVIRPTARWRRGSRSHRARGWARGFSRRARRSTGRAFTTTSCGRSRARRNWSANSPERGPSNTISSRRMCGCRTRGSGAWWNSRTAPWELRWLRTICFLGWHSGWTAPPTSARLPARDSPTRIRRPALATATCAPCTQSRGCLFFRPCAWAFRCTRTIRGWPMIRDCRPCKRRGSASA